MDVLYFIIIAYIFVYFSPGVFNLCVFKMCDLSVNEENVGCVVFVFLLDNH